MKENETKNGEKHRETRAQRTSAHQLWDLGMGKHISWALPREQSLCLCARLATRLWTQWIEVGDARWTWNQDFPDRDGEPWCKRPFSAKRSGPDGSLLRGAVELGPED